MRSSVKVAVILPSRGLIYSQTAEEILNNLKGISHQIFFSHRQPLPDCFEKPTRAALKDDSFTHLWFVEEDMILPANTLQKLLEADANAATCDYPVNKLGWGSVFCDNGGNVVFCGTGCLLVKREVFYYLKASYFTDQICWTMLNYGEAVKLVGSQSDVKDGYGLHDVTFCLKLWKQGIKIKLLPMKVGQRKLVELGKPGSNEGAHEIEAWHKIVKSARLKKIQQQPLATGAKGNLITVKTPTGEVRATRKHADTLVAKGLAEYPAKSYLILDDSGVAI